MDSHNILFLYLTALWQIASKVWRSPNRLRTLHRLTASERIVIVLTMTMVFTIVKWANAY